MDTSDSTGAAQRRITLIVHGTFAADEKWWRLGGGNASTFADRLEAALGKRGDPNTVWEPALRAGMGYEHFTWSGRNRHRDRVAGARKLARSLEALAEKLECSPQAPLQANFVAHSHGGNVVLEAIRMVRRSVRPRCVVLLGTPLISHRPAFRVMRVALAFFLTVILGVMVLVPLVKLFQPDQWAPDFGRFELFGWTAALIVIYGWLFWLIAQGLDLLVRGVFGLLRVVTGRSAGQAYGPPPRALRERLGGSRVVLFTSHQDEADLVLHLGTAPRLLYLEVVRAKLKGIRRVAEFVFVRPFVDGIGLKLLEVILERYVLGFSWLAVLRRDYEMADLKRGAAYPPSVLQRFDVTRDLLPALRHKISHTRSPSPLAPANFAEEDNLERHVGSLRESLRTVVRNLIAQVQLRHSVYYESDALTDRVAGILAGRDP